MQPLLSANAFSVLEGFTFEQYFSSRFKQFVIDAKRQGNVARFANHSCEPNMYVQPVFTETHDIRLPLVAFYTFDYTPAGTVSIIMRVFLPHRAPCRDTLWWPVSAKQWLQKVRFASVHFSSFGLPKENYVPKTEGYRLKN